MYNFSKYDQFKIISKHLIVKTEKKLRRLLKFSQAFLIYLEARIDTKTKAINRYNFACLNDNSKIFRNKTFLLNIE